MMDDGEEREFVCELGVIGPVYSAAWKNCFKRRRARLS